MHTESTDRQPAAHAPAAHDDDRRDLRLWTRTLLRHRAGVLAAIRLGPSNGEVRLTLSG